MEYTLNTPFDYDEQTDSPELDVEKECIRINISEINYNNFIVSFTFYITYMFPVSLVQRYQNVGQGLVLIVNDIDQQECFSVRTINDFIRYPLEEREGSNLISEPPSPLAPRGIPGDGGFGGGWIKGEISFQSTGPHHKPGVFVYIVLENYVSNTVGLDLTREKVIGY